MSSKKTKKTAHLRLSFFPANLAWGVTLGDAIVSVDDRMLWENRAELVTQLRRQGLSVDSRGVLHTT